MTNKNGTILNGKNKRSLDSGIYPYGSNPKSLKKVKISK